MVPTDLTPDDWKAISKLADVYYKRGTHPPDIDREDFRQLCAVAALHYENKLPLFTDHDGYIKSIVYYTAKKMHNKVRPEISIEDVSRILDDEKPSEFLELTHNLILKDALKVLSSLEYKILVLIYNNTDYEEIRKELKITKYKFYTALKEIKRKMGKR